VTPARHAAVLFTDAEIAARIETVADRIATMGQPPQMAAPILSGAFVFAADLLRALAKRGLSLPVEFLWLRSYAGARERQSAVDVRVGPTDTVRGQRVLVIDGVLDGGHTLARAREILTEAGAIGVTTAVAIDKRRGDAVLVADFALFTDVTAFVVGYGMDDAGRERALPHIAAIE
jgi:hypoxanthine phosphoribosyltransferase